MAVMRVSARNTNLTKSMSVDRYLIPAKPEDVSGSVGRSHNSDEVSVMDMEQRASVIWSYYFKQPL